MFALSQEQLSHIVFPLAEYTKREVRRLAKESGLRIHDKPACACLASRIPYGEKITRDKLMMVNKAEDFLKSTGIQQVRVRHHAYTARIEVDQNNIEKLCRKVTRDKIMKGLKKLGY